MIHFERGEPESSAAQESAPWPRLDPGGVALCTSWTTGPDPACDELVRLMATCPGARGEWQVLDLLVARHAGAPPLAATELACDETLAQEGAERIESGEAWRRLADFVGERVLLVPDAALFERWRQASELAAGGIGSALGLVELTALTFPGRLADRGARLVADFSSEAGPRLRAGFVHPLELAAAALELCDRVQAQPDSTRALIACGYGRAALALAELDPGAARKLSLALALLDQTSAWAPPIREPAADGMLRAVWSAGVSAEALLDELSPRVARRHSTWLELDPLPPTPSAPAPFHDQDLAWLDHLFEVELPAAFAAEHGGAREDAYRAGQHGVAREVARCLGGRELLLVHAPTGTGKTLAYLIPALLWARRHGVRVGISTYTRALQEQAMDRELPRALSALAAAGVPTGLRVSMLKGRENYLCWRSLRLGCPARDEVGEGWFAWTALVLFALTDEDGDLDRFPARPPLALRSTLAYRRQRDSYVRDARAQSSCCRRPEDKSTCGAELARRRAERSHLVITNHAFALARQEFFRHIVFDECEHLHDQAHNAWSHTVSLRELREALGRFHRPSRGSRALLDRVLEGCLPDSPAHQQLAGILEAWRDCALTLGALNEQIGAFDDWRRDARRTRDANHQHSLLREYLESPDEEARELIQARKAFGRFGARFDAALAELAEKLERMPVRNRNRVRRQLEQGRVEWGELLAAVDAWLPLQEGSPAFRHETFYDVEREGRGEWQLCARVLLPNEFLGRHYFPNLANAVLLSATTHLGGSFGPAKGFLGLDRAAQPLEDEQREASVVRTHLSPEAFDYSRVLVAAPRDAPSVSRDKELFLAYVRRFVQRLGERTRGRMLVLFTNAQDVQSVGRELQGYFRARQIPLWYQGMDGVGKEELGTLFRERTDSILLGVDTFWYGADFPGETLEYLVIARLPYGVPDGYHHAQCAALGNGEQRARIYLPRALAKIRQGFGRLMRRTTDRGCVFLLDSRVLDARHRAFLKELPLESSLRYGRQPGGLARFVRGDTDFCLEAAFEHMGLSVREAEPAPSAGEPAPPQPLAEASTRTADEAPPLAIDADDIPF